MPDAKMDFSVRNVPESWQDAAREGPIGAPGPLKERRVGARRMPSGRRPDLVTGLLAGIAATVVFGTAWIYMVVHTIITGPWMAVVLGVVVSLSVRYGAGPTGPEMRVTVGAGLYLTSLIVTNYFIVRQTYVSVYGKAPSFNDTEAILTTEYVTDPLTAACWVIGMAVMAWSTFAIRRRAN